MTTETSRRGLGILLVLLAIGTLVQAIYFAREDGEQQRCLSQNFQELSVALDKRAELSSRETEQNQALWGIYAEAAGLIKDDPTAELKPADQKQLQIDLVKQLLEYQRVIEDIREERRKNPLPPYPLGACGGD